MTEENSIVESAEAKGIAGVLGNPEGFVRRLCAQADVRSSAGLLLGLSVGGCAIFGFGVGCFVDSWVALVDAVKAAGIVLFSYLLCLPTLYVFASISGCRIGFCRLALVGLMALAAIGCVLAALAPVLWLFAVSTESTSLFILLTFALILVSVVLGTRTLGGMVAAKVVNHSRGLSAWYLIVLVVALQAITLVRPMLASSEDPRELSSSEKCFFMTHFLQSLN